MPFVGVLLIIGATSPELRGFAVTIKIRVGYEVAYQSPQPTAMVLTLRVHPSRAVDLVTPDTIVTTPPIAIGEYRDSFGNICSRIVARRSTTANLGKRPPYPLPIPSRC